MTNFYTGTQFLVIDPLHITYEVRLFTLFFYEFLTHLHLFREPTVSERLSHCADAHAVTLSLVTIHRDRIYIVYIYRFTPYSYNTPTAGHHLFPFTSCGPLYRKRRKYRHFFLIFYAST